MSKVYRIPVTRYVNVKVAVDGFVELNEKEVSRLKSGNLSLGNKPIYDAQCNDDMSEIQKAAEQYSESIDQKYLTELKYGNDTLEELEDYLIK